LATGARKAFLSELKTLFGIDFRDLEVGFNYLGYFIKPSSYKAKTGAGYMKSLNAEFNTGVTDVYQWVADIY
jgi:hypothetical protein